MKTFKKYFLITFFSFAFLILSNYCKKDDEHVLKTPGPDYYSYYFNISAKSIFFMNFKEVNISAPELNWLTNENRIHVIGGMYCSDKDIGDYYSQKISITEYFDAVFFFKYTNSTTYLPAL